VRARTALQPGDRGEGVAMRLPLPRPEHVPLNRVRALDLQAELAREFSKKAWQDALADARKRWAAEGNRPSRIIAVRKRRAYYVED
jgi:hypothetical protein